MGRFCAPKLMPAQLPSRLVINRDLKYGGQVKFGCRCHVVGLIAALLFFSLSNFAAQYKPIRLRNQPNAQPVGKTNAPAALARALARESGLFLVQFHGPPSSETRVKLIAAGIDL